ncbi:hypothetical protein ATANTOWER_004263, partial [Ataeniobius toweri]|nr:hypothetical protein [Ataeniobius toweri]
EKLAEMIKHPSSRPPMMSITARTNCTHDTGMGKKRATNQTLLDLLRCLQRKQNKQTAC